MRDIKFRVWDKEQKKIYLPEDEEAYYNNCSDIGINGSQIGAGDSPSGWSKIGDKFELMQYTGLKDKNGKEIYEGDIVKEFDKEEKEELIAEVQWNNFGCKFDLCDGIDIWDIWEDKDIHEYEVIGNIYENPNLLKCVN